MRPATMSSAESVGLPGRRKLLLDIGSTFGTRVLLFPMTIIAGILVSRALQPEGKGVYASALTVTNLAILFGALGINKGAMFHLGRGDVPAPAVYRASFWLSLVNGVILTVAIAAMGYWLLPRWLPEVPRSAVIIAAPLALVTLLRMAVEAYLRSAHRNLQVNLTSLASAAVLVIGMGVAFAADVLTPDLALVVRSASVAAAGVLGAVLLGRGISAIGRPGWSGQSARAILSYGIPFGVVSLLQNLHYDVDLLMVQAIRGSADAGIYSTSIGIAELLWFLPLAVLFVVVPRATSTQTEAVATETAALMRWTLLVTIGLAIGVLAFGGVAIGLLYGDAFLGAVAPLRILVVGVVTGSLYLVLSAFLAGQGKLVLVGLATGAGLVVNVSLNLVLIPSLGGNGAAISSAVSYTVSGVLALIFFSRYTAIPVTVAVLPSVNEIKEQTARLYGRWRLLSKRGIHRGA